MKTPLFIEQHFHGCYGIDFNKASVDEVLELSHRILREGVGYIFPTLVTDSLENTKDKLKLLKMLQLSKLPIWQRFAESIWKAFFLIWRKRYS